MSYPVFGIKKQETFHSRLNVQQQIVFDLETHLVQPDLLTQQLNAPKAKTERLWKSVLQQAFKFENEA